MALLCFAAGCGWQFLKLPACQHNLCYGVARGFLAEYGIVIAKGIRNLKTLLSVIEDNQDKLSLKAQRILQQLCEQFTVFEADMKNYDQQIEHTVSEDPMCQAILKIEGVGPDGCHHWRCKRF